MKGYVYIPFLILILVAFGFVLSGGFILSEESSSTTESTDQYTLVETGSSSSSQTLQILTLKGQVIPTPTLPTPITTPITNTTIPIPPPTTNTNPPTTGGCTPNPAENCAFYGLSEDQTPCIVDHATSCGAIRCYERPCIPTPGCVVTTTCISAGYSYNPGCASVIVQDNCGGYFSCNDCSQPTPIPTRPITPAQPIPTKEIPLG